MENELKTFAWAMEERLQLNKHRTARESFTVEMMLLKAVEKISEINQAFTDGERRDVIVRKCVDLANWAYFISAKEKEQK